MRSQNNDEKLFSLLYNPNSRVKPAGCHTTSQEALRSENEMRKQLPFRFERDSYAIVVYA